MIDYGKVSVIIPVASGPVDLLAKSIRSVQDQSYSNFEIIIVLNNQSSECESTVYQIANKDSRVKVITSDAGVSAARNKGLNNAKGAYISFLDADDWIESDFIENLLKELVDESVDIVMCANFRDYSDRVSSTKPSSSIASIPVKMHSNEARNALLLQRFILPDVELTSVWGAIYKKASLSNRKFDEKLMIAEDFWFQYNNLGKDKAILFIPKYQYHYLIRKTGVMSSSMSPEKMNSFRNITSKIDTHEVELDDIPYFKARMVSLAFSLLYMNFKVKDCHCQQELKQYIKSNRREVVSIKGIRMKLRIALVLSKTGFLVPKMAFMLNKVISRKIIEHKDSVMNH